MKNGIVNIHGKDYMTVAKRVELAHKDNALETVESEIVSHAQIQCQAVLTSKKVATCLSAKFVANPQLKKEDLLGKERCIEEFLAQQARNLIQNGFQSKVVLTLYTKSGEGILNPSLVKKRGI